MFGAALARDAETELWAGSSRGTVQVEIENACVRRVAPPAPAKVSVGRSRSEVAIEAAYPAGCVPSRDRGEARDDRERADTTRGWKTVEKKARIRPFLQLEGALTGAPRLLTSVDRSARLFEYIARDIPHDLSVRQRERPPLTRRAALSSPDVSVRVVCAPP